MIKYILFGYFVLLQGFSPSLCKSESSIEKPYICGPLKMVSQNDFDECEKQITTAGLSYCQICFPETTWHEIVSSNPDKNDKKWSKHFLGNITARIKKIKNDYKKHLEESKGLNLSKEQKQIAYNDFTHKLGLQISYEFFKKYNEKTNFSHIDQSSFNDNPSLYLNMLQTELSKERSDDDQACAVKELKSGKIRYKGKIYVLEASMEAITGEVATEISSIADGPQTPKPNEEATTTSNTGTEPTGAPTNKQ